MVATSPCCQSPAVIPEITVNLSTPLITVNCDPPVFQVECDTLPREDICVTVYVAGTEQVLPVTVTVPAGTTVAASSVALDLITTVRWLVSLKNADETVNQSFEVQAKLSVDKSSVSHSRYAIIGDPMAIQVTVEINALELDLNIANNSMEDIIATTLIGSV